MKNETTMSYELIDTELISKLINRFDTLQNQISQMSANQSQKTIYTNKEIMALLGIKDKTLKRYRDDGKLGYHKEGDKFWYTQADIDLFLANNHEEAYAYNN